MKRLIFTLLVIIGLLSPMLGVGTASAIDLLNPGGGTPGTCNNSNAASTPGICNDNKAGGTNPIFGPDGIITVIINILALVIGVVSVIIIIVAGFRMVLAGSDSNTAATARRAVIYAAVGLAIALSAETLVAFVLSKL